MLDKLSGCMLPAELRLCCLKPAISWNRFSSCVNMKELEIPILWQEHEGSMLIPVCSEMFVDFCFSFFSAN